MILITNDDGVYSHGIQLLARRRKILHQAPLIKQAAACFLSRCAT